MNLSNSYILEIKKRSCFTTTTLATIKYPITFDKNIIMRNLPKHINFDKIKIDYIPLNEKEYKNLWESPNKKQQFKIIVLDVE